MSYKSNKTDVELTPEQTAFFTDCKKSKVVSLSGSFILDESGDSYSDSVRLAFEWRDRCNADRDYPAYINLKDYYAQIHSGKSIKVSYERAAKQTETGAHLPNPFLEEDKKSILLKLEEDTIE